MGLGVSPGAVWRLPAAWTGRDLDRLGHPPAQPALDSAALPTVTTPPTTTNLPNGRPEEELAGGTMRDDVYVHLLGAHRNP